MPATSFDVTRAMSASVEHASVATRPTPVADVADHDEPRCSEHLLAPTRTHRTWSLRPEKQCCETARRFPRHAAGGPWAAGIIGSELRLASRGIRSRILRDCLMAQLRATFACQNSQELSYLSWRWEVENSGMEERVLAGRYRLIAKLGQGGMGSVWRAEHLTLRTQVAIKLIDFKIAESREAAARFQREAQSAAELRSTHIVQILDYGIDDGTPYIAMELLEGESLAARLVRLKKLTPSQTALTLSQVARALARAHQRGIVHRDLKPDNIFIVQEDADEVVKVLDFGIAKKLDGLSGSSGVKTHTGMLLGTPFYMSPEQGLGQPDIDQRADIWSMAVIAFECMTGTRPFYRDTLGALLMAICYEPMSKPSQIGSVPAGFDEWFARAAARDRSARFQTAAEAAAELRVICSVVSERPSDEVQPTLASPAAVGGEMSATVTLNTPALLETAGPASVTLPGIPKQQSRPLLRFLVVPTLVLLVAGGYTFWRRFQRPPPVSAVSSAQQLPTLQSPNDPHEHTAAVGLVVQAPASANPSVPGSSTASTQATGNMFEPTERNHKATPTKSLAKPAASTEIKPAQQNPAHLRLNAAENNRNPAGF